MHFEFTVVWDETLLVCSLVDDRRHRFRKALYLYLTGKRVKMGAPRYYETLVG